MYYNYYAACSVIIILINLIAGIKMSTYSANFAEQYFSREMSSHHRKTFQLFKVKAENNVILYKFILTDYVYCY